MFHTSDQIIATSPPSMQPEGQRILHLDLWFGLQQNGETKELLGATFGKLAASWSNWHVQNVRISAKFGGVLVFKLAERFWFLRKSPNVLCAPLWTAKLCDFGLATCFFWWTVGMVGMDVGKILQKYCWWKKSCANCYFWITMNNRMFSILTGAGFLPSTVWQWFDYEVFILLCQEPEVVLPIFFSKCTKKRPWKVAGTPENIYLTPQTCWW